MIDATYLRVPRTACSLRADRGGPWSPDRPHQSSITTQIHAVTDTNGRPSSFLMTVGQVSNYIDTAALLDYLRKSSGCSATATMMPTGSKTPRRPHSVLHRWSEIATSRSDTPSAANRTAAASVYIPPRQRLAKRRRSLRYMPDVFFSGIGLAATVIFRRDQQVLTVA